MRRDIKASAGSRRRASSGTLWSPSDLDNLVAHFDAQDATSITLSGSDVTNWLDQTANNNDLEQTASGNRPTYSATGFDGTYPGISFNSANSEYLRTPDSGFDWGGTIGERSIALIFDRPASGGGGERMVSYIDAADAQDTTSTKSSIPFYRGSNDNIYSHNGASVYVGPSVSSGVQIWISMYSVANSEVTQIVNDGTPTVHSATQFNHDVGELGIAGQPKAGGGNHTSMDVAELIITADLLTAEEITNIQTYAARWGI